MEENLILLCEDSIDGIFTAIYDGWIYGNKGRKVFINSGSIENYELFTEYIAIETDYNKAVKVAQAINTKISPLAYDKVYDAAHHYDVNRGTYIMEFLKYGFKAGHDAISYTADDRVMRIIELSRKVCRESHLFLGTVRFSDIKGELLYSKVEPKCRILPLIGDHFSDRLQMENFIIYDHVHHEAIFHKKNTQWILINNNDFDFGIYDNLVCEDDYCKLWKEFYNTIAIEARTNERCQNTMLPKWYRKNMVEFS